MLLQECNFKINVEHLECQEKLKKQSVMPVCCMPSPFRGIRRKADHRLPGRGGRKLWSSLAAAMVAMLLLWPASASAADRRLVPDTNRKVVVLDPGHGGNDRGTRGPDGVLEKDVSLQIARMVAIRMRNTHRIILTRSDDYSLPLFQRTEAANYHNADLFLSIHTGGDFLHRKSGMTVFSYEEKRNQALDQPGPENTGRRQPSWNRVQLAHRTASRKLATSLYDRFCSMHEDALLETTCRIEDAPLMVLMGADMPAALIEVGYLTNPQDENRLSNKEGQSKIAAAITDGIVDFLSGYSGDSDGRQ